MKKCKSCQKEIDPKATKCPYCQTDLRSWFRRHPILTFLGIIIALPMVIGAFGPPTSEKSKQNEKSTPETKVEETKTTEAAPEKIAGLTEYYQQFMPINTRVSQYLSKRAEILQKYPDLTTNDIVQFAATGIGLELAYDEAIKLTPPEEMASPHQKWIKALSLFKQSVPLTNKGIDNLNADLLNQSADLLRQGAKLLNEATKETEEIAKKFK